MPNQQTVWLLTTAVFVALLVPKLVQHGMFLDGVSYAAISRNMAEGIGSFSEPQYTQTLYRVCHEQPPLVFWLQSNFFRLFGDHSWVERLYTFCMAILSAFTIVLNWKLWNKVNTAWLPIVIWILTPIVFWSYQNNMLECTMTAFALLACYFACRSVLEDRLVWLLPAAVFTVAGVLSKGPVGFFPLMAPLAAGLIVPQGNLARKMMAPTIMFCLTALLFVGFIYLMPGMQTYLENYLNTRLLPTLSGQRDTVVGNRFQFLLDMVGQMALPLIAMLGFILLKGRSALKFNSAAIVYLSIGLAGSLPLFFSPKQSAHYLVPALPMFALGFATLLWGQLGEWKSARFKSEKGLNLSRFVLFASLLVSFSFWGQYSRHELLIKDVSAITPAVPSGSILGATPSLASDWVLVAYLIRMGHISLENSLKNEYYLCKTRDQAPVSYPTLAIKTTDLSLWKH